MTWAGGSSMRVTPARIQAAYAYLRGLPPFDKWDLPPPGRMEFDLERDPADHASFLGESPPRLCVNPHLHHTLDSLHISVAHEMVHLRQHLLGRLSPETPNDGHNTEFRRLSAQVCRSLGFDVQTF